MYLFLLPDVKRHSCLENNKQLSVKRMLPRKREWETRKGRHGWPVWPILLRESLVDLPYWHYAKQVLLVNKRSQLLQCIIL